MVDTDGEGETSLLRRFFAAGDAGDLDAFDNLLDEDVVVHAPLGFATNGREEEKAAWRRALQGAPDLLHSIQETLSAGSTEVARVVVTGTHRGEFVGLPATGNRFEIDQVTFVHIRDGKAEEIWEVDDKAEVIWEVADTALLLKQLGGE